MTINRYRFYLGNYGNLKALPPLPQGADPDVNTLVMGAVHQSLTGRVTRDRLGGNKRAWKFQWERLKQDDLTVIEGFTLGAFRTPYFLIDGRRKNILPADVSAAGSVSRTKAAFTPSAGTLAFGLAANPPAEFTGVLDGCLNWTGVVNGNTLMMSGDRIPILAGSTYRFSAYLTGTTTCRLTAFPYDASNVAQATVTSSNLTLTGSYQRFDFVYTPGGTSYSVRFGLTATGSGNISTLGWQAEMDQALSAWAFGFGCPMVVLGESPESGYPLYGFYRHSLSLLEV